VSVIKDMGRKELCKGEDGYKTTHNKIQYKKSGPMTMGCQVPVQPNISFHVST